jgi:transcriptional regulator with GAF, ATPase, and Fis domain
MIDGWPQGCDKSTDGEARFHYDIDQKWPSDADLSDIFVGLTRKLQDYYLINRGIFLLKEKDATCFMAISTWNNGKTRKNLCLHIPPVSSLFEKVAEHGQVYSESFCQLFSGNSFERNLLIDDTAQSYVLQPLKLDGDVVGLIAYSSEDPTVFTTFEDGALERVAQQLAARVGRKVTEKTGS